MRSHLSYNPLLQARSMYPSPLGVLHLVTTNTGLAGAWFESDKHFDIAQLQSVPVQPEHSVLQQAHAALDRYFAGGPLQSPPLDFVEGTPFQQQVWHTLRQIQQGHSTSYGALAAQLGKPGASRAIGAAVGRNPISIFVPCHRVLGSQRQLTGYTGGLDRKIALLLLESITFV